MSLYQCGECGCLENTALGMAPGMPTKWFDWTGIEDREGKHLCCVCAPPKYRSGTPTGYGEWHNQFDRVFLPKGQFKTNRIGNLEHIETGSEDYKPYIIRREPKNG